MEKNNKSSLFLMEMLFSIFIFAVAAAICMKMFVTSHVLSRDSVRLNHAVVWCESMAEGFYSVDGSIKALNELLGGSLLDDSQIAIYYSDEFVQTDSAEEGYYVLTGTLRMEGDMRYLDIVCLCTGDKEEIYSITCGLLPKEGIDEE